MTNKEAIKIIQSYNVFGCGYCHEGGDEITNMDFMKLTYGHEAIQELADFLKDNHRDGYSLSVFDVNEQNTVEIDCDFNDVLEVIKIFITAEHTFPYWIGDNCVSHSYVVGMEFSRGYFHAPSFYTFRNGKLKRLNY